MLHSIITAVALLSCLAQGQLSGKVGPTTTFASEAAKKICNVLDYGAKADGKTDLGAPLTSAWVDCRKGGLVYIPPGTFAMSTWASLRSGQGAALQLDGIIQRTGTAGGNMISFQSCDDLEVFSGNSKGAIQGFGYQSLSQGNYGPRFIRLTDVTNFSMHGFALVDSPSYYLVFDTSSNGEIYNMILRGITVGMTDAIDIWGNNIWVHDVEITNGDECVTIKSPAKNILVEDVHCNISGGCAIGSLGLDTDISTVQYNNIYLNQADGAYVKTNGGSGTVDSIIWENIINNGGNWHGYNSDSRRPTIRLQCDDSVPCTDLTVDNVNLWTSDGSKQVTWVCQSAYGKGACLRNSGSASYAASYTTIKTAPAYSASKMPNDLKSAFPSTAAFTIPPVPTTFYPGKAPASTLLSLSGPGGQ
ncbi:murein transglycosylase [Diaporthe helianthi]|uniref:Murein transglycosylase n=1 Tax=Diaporthe helianthi TaxID=158607 RepID=A0A2P5HEX7_DIAHE|nr:murein transglycosylase [Diaporthe helianthi]